MDYRKLTDEHLDALREVSNIGMGHAATALSQLIGRTVRLQVPKILMSEIKSVPEILGGAEKVVIGIYLQILGDARGNILLIFPRESAQQLLGALLPEGEIEGSSLTEMEASTLKEVGNILASAYLSALGSLVGMVLIPSIPMLSFDMAGAVVDYVLIELGEVGDLALVVETEFYGEDHRISGHLFIFPDPQSLSVILKAIEQ
jgi:chemotaxis protein CheC